MNVRPIFYWMFMVQTLGLWIRSISWLSSWGERVSIWGFSTLKSRNKNYLCIVMSLSGANLLLYVKISHELADLVWNWDGYIFDIIFDIICNLVTSTIYGCFKTIYCKSFMLVLSLNECDWNIFLFKKNLHWMCVDRVMLQVPLKFL